MERGSEPSQIRQGSKAALIGIVATVLSVALPILIVIVLAFLAQVIITGH